MKEYSPGSEALGSVSQFANRDTDLIYNAVKDDSLIICPCSTNIRLVTNQTKTATKKMKLNTLLKQE